MVSRAARLLLIVCALHGLTLQCAAWQNGQLDAPTEDQEDGDDTILMQTTAHFDRRGAPGASHIWSLFVRFAVGVLFILPALMVYMGVPDSLQAASLSLSSSLLGRGGLRGSGSDTSRRLTATSVATSNSSGAALDEAMLDQLLDDADTCCDGAAPGLQTSFKLLPGAPASGKLVSPPDSAARTEEPVSEDVVDAIMSESAPDELKPVLQTGLKLLKSAKQANGYPARTSDPGAGTGSLVSEDVLDAIMNDVDPLEELPPALQTNFKLLQKEKSSNPVARDDILSEAVVDAIMNDVSEETFGSTPALQSGFKLLSTDNVHRHVDLDDTASEAVIDIIVDDKSDEGFESTPALPKLLNTDKVNHHRRENGLVSEAVVDAIMNDISDEGSTPSLQTAFKLLSTKKPHDDGRGHKLVSEKVVNAIMEDMSGEEASPVLQLQTGALIVKKSKPA
jgi:hypothetical protein